MSSVHQAPQATLKQRKRKPRESSGNGEEEGGTRDTGAIHQPYPLLPVKATDSCDMPRNKNKKGSHNILGIE